MWPQVNFRYCFATYAIHQWTSWLRVFISKSYWLHQHFRQSEKCKNTAKQPGVQEKYFVNNPKQNLRPFSSAECDLYVSSTFIPNKIFSPQLWWVTLRSTVVLSLSWACRCDIQPRELYSEMLLTDRFHSSHRLEWFCLFLGCGLGQWLVLNSRCFSSGGCNLSVRCRGRQKRAM